MEQRHASAPADHHTAESTAEPPEPQGRAAASPTRRHTARLDGVDLARWIAIFGMLIVHFWVPFLDPIQPTNLLIEEYAWGRSTILFTFLAGVTLALLTGGTAPHRGHRARLSTGRVAVRGGALLVFGLVLSAIVTPTGAGLTVIIAYYGLYFLLALPFLRLTAGWLAGGAVVAALVGPQLLFVLRRSSETGGAMAEFALNWNQVDIAQRLADQGLLELTVFGFYPALSSLAVILAGLAVGRLDLWNPQVRVTLMLLGGALAFVSYRISWHAWETYGLAWELGPQDDLIGPVPTHDARWLWTSMPHTSTTLEVAGGVGVALIVVPACLFLAERFPTALWPFTAAGTMALTIYSTHALLMAWDETVPDGSGGVADWISGNLAAINVLGAVAFAFAWRRYVGRGPLEAGISTLSTTIVPDPPRRETQTGSE
ncbi:DUF418 domain-containing protein [Lipingzhangella sp. LS1_29]|uniref:DUF418 domain-containing protein n=1 Tax=Lipingzhangella rawalii TaxID=2055835 RepID=A0ABU2H9A5_9ACTN|nr:DUF418 domain-containing protein [Lipingzhangella rawalii]MDS1271848.1 DUF418 domain-containing protein [Lipingzhangella rawalii]